VPQAVATVDEATRIQELRRALLQADSGAFLAEPRVIRRIIREQHGFARLSTSIPHVESQVVSAFDLRTLTHPDELGLAGFAALPQHSILIAQPEEDQLNHWPMQELLQLVWRRLFHATIDRELQAQCRRSLTRAEVQHCIHQVGEVEFDEAHAVLISELRLVHTASRMEAWCEFCALWTQFRFFSPDLLPVWFPSLAGSERVDQLIRERIPADEIFQSTRLYGAAPPSPTPRIALDEAKVQNSRHDWTLRLGVRASDRAFVRHMRRRDRANEKGNTVAAGICGMRAAEQSTSSEKQQNALQKVNADVEHLVERLRKALNFDAEDAGDWQASLQELLRNSVHGFWNADKRLLYDLQKVCLDHERVTYRVDLVKWIVSRGRRPLRRPLTSVREVMMAKHLASAARRLVYVRLSGSERRRLQGLLTEAAHLAEDQMRLRMRPAIRQALLEVGAVPQSIPEQVGFDKLVEESLDCIAERGYLTMAYLRDAISRNDLKLDDLSDPRELIRGDHLLRADDRLDIALDGVYRRGEFYLRWLQVVSSLFFGTRTGRFATLFLAIPFGGAVIIVEGVRHLWHVLSGTNQKSAVRPGATAGEQQSATDESEPAAESESSDSDANQPTTEVGDSPSTAAGQVAGATGDNSAAAARPALRDTDSGEEDLTAAAVSGESAADLQDAGSVDESGVGDAVTDSSPTGEPDTGATSTNAVEAVGSTGNTATSQAATQTDDGTVAIVGVEDVDPFRQIITEQVSSFSLVIVVGFMLMGLIHSQRIRSGVVAGIRAAWSVVRSVVLEIPRLLIRLPIVQRIWRSRTFVKIRRMVITPLLISFTLCQIIPFLLFRNTLSWWWVATIAALLSVTLNSRLARDAEELTAEWLGNVWHDLHARIFGAVLNWIIDFFKQVLGLLERLLYAVDEWLRFHSGESWATLILKAVLGVFWSFISFLIRIYVTLLIEPTLHPVKHFPVVTVAHKIMFPLLLWLENYLRHLLSPHLGLPLTASIVWFNIFFLPGIFGFAVWELKENWRLYKANRHPGLRPAIVGSHGESLARLLRPGFHSGTLPKLFRWMRRLEQREASFRRFSYRRAAGERLEHIERDVHRFVDRDLIRLLGLVPAWKDMPLRCGRVACTSNSIVVDIHCDQLADEPLQILFQEQSAWIVATVPSPGWLRFAVAEQRTAVENALNGLYKKAAIDLVREQLRDALVQAYPYDINADGLTVWPEDTFQTEIDVDLHRRGQLRPVPAAVAWTHGLRPTDRQEVVFSASVLLWTDWVSSWGGGPQPDEPVLRTVDQSRPRCRLLPETQ
jgi:hypothetical protein